MKAGFISVLTLALFIGGCSSTPQGRFDITARRITIITDPPGAAVTQINPLGQPVTALGTTPIEDRSVMVVSRITKMKNMPYPDAKELMEQVDNVVVDIKKEGYKPYHGTLKTVPGETVTCNIELQPE